LFVKGGEDGERFGVVLPSINEVKDSVLGGAKGASNECASNPRRFEFGEMGEGDAVNAFGFAKVTVPFAQPSEPKVRVRAARIQLHSFHVAAHRKRILVRGFERMRYPYKL
jgi:hypothetical protein